MSFFRRLRRDKEESPEEGPAKAAPEKPKSKPADEAAAAPPSPGAGEGATAPVPEAEAVPSAPEAESMPPTSLPPATTSVGGGPLTVGPPPPLPGPGPASSLTHAAQMTPFSLCFVCETPLEGKYCPTCKITWVE